MAVNPRPIPYNAVVQMVQNFIDLTYKKLGPGAPVKVTYDQDSHGVFYRKSDVDNLFLDNGFDPANPGAHEWGVRLYLGLHQHTAFEDAAMPDRPESYIGQHTAILVCTCDGEEMLDTGLTTAAGGGGGLAVEEGQICPPPPCGKVDNGLHP